MAFALLSSGVIKGLVQALHHHQALLLILIVLVSEALDLLLVPLLSVLQFLTKFVSRLALALDSQNGLTQLQLPVLLIISFHPPNLLL